MKVPREKQDSRLMQAMFDAIAPRYDFVTRAFSAGLDRKWKRDAVREANLPSGATVLDLASGTGDFSLLVRERDPAARPVAVDLTHSMLVYGKIRGLPEAVCGDAMLLPFSDGMFDAAFVGFGLRNFPDLQTALSELRRVLKPGGTLVIYDFFLPEPRLWRWIYLGYLYLQGAFWGLLLHGKARIYTYIPDSLRAFTTTSKLAALLEALGYEQVRTRSLVFGGLAIQWALKR